MDVKPLQEDHTQVLKKNDPTIWIYFYICILQCRCGFDWFPYGSKISWWFWLIPYDT